MHNGKEWNDKTILLRLEYPWPGVRNGSDSLSDQNDVCVTMEGFED